GFTSTWPDSKAAPSRCAVQYKVFVPSEWCLRPTTRRTSTTTRRWVKMPAAFANTSTRLKICRSMLNLKTRCPVARRPVYSRSRSKFDPVGGINRRFSMLRIKRITKDEAPEDVRTIFAEQEKQYWSILNTAK